MRQVLVSTLIVMLLGSICSGQNPPEKLTGDMDADFKWYDTLGFPDVKGCVYARVATDLRYMTGDEPRQEFVTGFILKDDGDSFTVLTPDLFTDTFKRNKEVKWELEPTGYTPVDLETAAAAKLAELRKPIEDRMRLRLRLALRFAWNLRHSFKGKLPERAQAFVLARQCAQHGLLKNARELYELVSTMRRQLEDPKMSIREAVSEDFAYAGVWGAVLSFGNIKVSRKELLAEFRKIQKKYPETRHSERVNQTIALLEKMVGEDEDYAAYLRLNPVAETQDQRVAELIFLLRDQNGQQCSQPGSCNIFNDREEKEDSPAHELVKLSFEAVPRLLDALSDARFTRSVDYHRDFYFSHRVLRVAECAHIILYRITGVDFRNYEGPDQKKYPDLQTAARAWWEEFNRMGGKQGLIDGTSLGNPNSISQARLLLKRYPRSALAAVIAGAQKTKDSRVSSSLVKIAGEIAGDAPVPFLKKELTNAPDLTTRLAAAQALHKRKVPEAVTAMIAEWNKPHAYTYDKEWYEFDGELVELSRFLSTSGSPKAIRTLAAGFRKRSVALRFSIISSFNETDGSNWGISSSGHTSGGPVDGPVSLDRKFNVAVEDLLVASLDDTEERPGMYVRWGKTHFEDPRICDAAAHVLGLRWPKKYSFDVAAPLSERDRRLVQLINIRRRERGEKPLPVPEPRTIPQLPKAQTDALIRKIADAPAVEARKKAIAAIEKLGVGALQAVAAEVRRRDADDPLRKEFDQLWRKMACIVVEVKMDKGSLPLEATLSKALGNLKGKPLTAGAFVGLLRQFAKAARKGEPLLKLSADRENGVSGVLFTVALTKTLSTKFNKDGFDITELVIVNASNLPTSGGYSSTDYLQTPEGYDDLSKSINQAVASPAAHSIRIRVSMR